MNEEDLKLAQRAEEIAEFLSKYCMSGDTASHLAREIVREQGVIGDDAASQVNSREFHAAMSRRGYFRYLGIWSSDPSIYGARRGRRALECKNTSESELLTEDELREMEDALLNGNSIGPPSDKCVARPNRGDQVFRWIKAVVKSLIAAAVFWFVWLIYTEKPARTFDAQYARNSERVGHSMILSVLLLVAWIVIVRFKRRCLPQIDDYSPSRNPGCVWVFSGVLAGACSLIGNQWFVLSLVLAMIFYGFLKADNNPNV